MLQAEQSPRTKRAERQQHACAVAITVQADVTPSPFPPRETFQGAELQSTQVKTSFYPSASGFANGL
jgi:hypothetical protein